ncbi:uncharacterized protein N7515_004617 [Penicillium bovifimosum]|uniref:Uncharacterized protein n=1 Tax=Penicillium bovifimosum TaxID=126998 RepID=A0A9W9H0G1_9EURO|nr:uncharacterized protein N7515_004617 [Penicillium bovifimosum]KAJ5135339.1 hypothetical protein N7515_004617 [Penicillium bovifimosum]
MDSGPIDTSKDGISTAEGGRPLRDTKAKQDQQAKLDKKREQLEELKKVEEGDLSHAQKKKIAKLEKELGIDETSKSVDPQSKPQYPESTPGDREGEKNEECRQTPGLFWQPVNPDRSKHITRNG